MRKRFGLRTYHCGLKHLFGKPTLNVGKTRWLEFLSECDFKIKHIKGKENQVVDALIRRTQEVHVSSIDMYTTYLKDKILEATNLDQLYFQTKENLQQENSQQKFSNF